MSLAHAILASLVEEATSGYELVKDFNERIACYWQASQQQIYRELNRLEEQGWIAGERVIQTDRPNKKLYRITPAGLQALKEWVAQPSDPAAIREELLVKVLAGYLVDPLVIRAEVQRRREYHQARLEHYHQVEEAYFQNLTAAPLPKQFMYRTLRRGIRYEADWVAWCDETLEWLNGTASSATPGTKPEAAADWLATNLG
ncbi:PadR family transcriptional regulator [Thermostichus vulcanus]|uniref:PadR family transcriptional regulator n=1 Tax=Thermostichus vulcanus str. 'Rupite' TaxID=2813851 RepID=A0ABT0CCT3_THEVL|nr:PadR family transcriptional regulator [Thermostichus vulcanus]MCJ2543603.1 PadR family transcriptional regulator [Thermostichus vulcanus str. 'Rupite']